MSNKREPASPVQHPGRLGVEGPAGHNLAPRVEAAVRVDSLPVAHAANRTRELRPAPGRAAPRVRFHPCALFPAIPQRANCECPN